MEIRDRLLAGYARQLGHPAGRPGHLVAALLDRANRATVAAAVDALAPDAGAAAADLGFGGGLSLGLLLDRAVAQGRVYGVEVSSLLLRRAARRFRGPVASGRLRLLGASLARLPLAGAALDAVMTVNTLYFVPDLDGACAEVIEALRRAGLHLIDHRRSGRGESAPHVLVVQSSRRQRGALIR